MVVFPNCKINIGLQITGKRTDGFHDLETVFFPVALKDALEVIPAAGQKEAIIYTSSGNVIEGATKDNLCIRAYHLIKKDHTGLPALKMHLHKAIPSGAGLGGGSADAAFTLRLIDQLFSLQLTEARLAEYALLLGSDCPFFLLNKPAFASGRGEMLEPVSINLSDYRILIVNPRIHVNTGWAFSQLQPPSLKHEDLKTAICQPVDKWKEFIRNDFEAAVFSTHPEIASIKKTLYKEGAVYASMSGSGSSVFGIFKKGKEPQLNFPAHYFCKLV